MFSFKSISTDLSQLFYVWRCSKLLLDYDENNLRERDAIEDFSDIFIINIIEVSLTKNQSHCDSKPKATVLTAMSASALFRSYRD